MCVLEQQLYSRLVFYGRFMNAALPFRTGILTGEDWSQEDEAEGERGGDEKERRERMQCDADFHP